jgi:probable HAF family extracellular repeat protein
MTSMTTKLLKRLALLAALMVATLLLYASGATTQTTCGGYTVIDLGTLGGYSSARDINEAGQVVGFSTTASGRRAFLYSEGQMTDLDTLPGARSSIATDINDAGQVVGNSSTADEIGAGFLYSDGQMKDLNSLIAAGSGWYVTAARAINNKGQIAAEGRMDGQGQQHVLLLEPPGADTTAPTAQEGGPTNGATRVSRTTDVVATFSEQMDKTTLTSATFKLYKVTTKGTAQITDVTVTPSADGLTAKLNPYGNKATLLDKSSTYQAVVTTSATDLAGNALDQSLSAKGNQPLKWSFETGS